MTLVLKSNVALDSSSFIADFLNYKSRVEADGGDIVDTGAVINAINFVKSNLNKADVFSATSPMWGVKKSGSSIVKMYSLFNSEGDIITSEGNNTTEVAANGHLAIKHTGGSGTPLQSTGNVSSVNIGVFVALQPLSLTSTTLQVAGLSPDTDANNTYLQMRLMLTSARQDLYYNSTNSKVEVPYAAKLGEVLVRGGAHKDGTLYSFINDTQDFASSTSATIAGNGHSFYVGGYQKTAPNRLIGLTMESWCVKNISQTGSASIVNRLNSLYR